MKHHAIIVAGGLGQRMEKAVPKQFLLLANKPVIAWSVETCITSPLIDVIIIAIHPDYTTQLTQILNTHFPQNKIIITNGGSTRQESCFNALNAYSFDSNDIVLIHDAARPFITTSMIQECVETTTKYGASGIYTRVKETIAQVNNDTVIKVLPRSTLCAAQTPQCFRYSIIMDAHKKALQKNILDATDDISLVIDAGYPVKAIIGNYYNNIKITTQEDITIAESIINNNLK